MEEIPALALFCRRLWKKKETIGDRIAKTRVRRGMSKTQLARLTEVSPNAISMYESGKRIPSTKLVISLSESLRVSTDYLLLGNWDRTVNLSGLEENEYLAVLELIGALREKNKRLDVFRPGEGENEA